MKEIKAWAVVDETGIALDTGADERMSALAIYKTAKVAKTMRQDGERVVRVTVRVEE